MDNPGAAIRVLEVVSNETTGRHLRPGDRVWRERIELGAGMMRFEVGSNCVVTVHAPALVELKDEQSLNVLRGGVFLDVKDKVVVGVSRQRILLANTSVGIVADEQGDNADMLVTDGVACLGHDGFFKPRDGARISVGGKVTRYRSMEAAEIVRGRFLARMPSIRIERRRSENVL